MLKPLDMGLCEELVIKANIVWKLELRNVVTKLAANVGPQTRP